MHSYLGLQFLNWFYFNWFIILCHDHMFYYYESVIYIISRYRMGLVLFVFFVCFSFYYFLFCILLRIVLTVQDILFCSIWMDKVRIVFVFFPVTNLLAYIQITVPLSSIPVHHPISRNSTWHTKSLQVYAHPLLVKTDKASVRGTGSTGWK